MIKKVAVMALGILASSLAYAGRGGDHGLRPLSFELPSIVCDTLDIVECNQAKQTFTGFVYELGGDRAAYLFRGLQRVTLSSGSDVSTSATDGTDVLVSVNDSASAVYNLLESARLIRKIRSMYDESISIRCDMTQYECLQVLKKFRSFGNGLSLASQCADRESGEFGCTGLAGIYITIGQGPSSARVFDRYVVGGGLLGDDMQRTGDYDLLVSLNGGVSRAQIWNLFSNLSDSH